MPNGSRRYFAYFDDTSAEKYMHLDESIAESIALGFGQAVTPSIFREYSNRIFVSTKGGIQPRYILAQRVDADDRVVKRKFYVGSLTASVWGAGINTALIDGLTWSITAKVGEVRLLPPLKDTGLIDGDVDDNATVSS